LTTAGEARIARRQDVLLTRTGDEALLVDERDGSVHVINHTAARVWELSEPGPTMEQLVESMASAYEVTGAAVRDDVESMVATFGDLGLLQIDPAR
jgi:hypothetical protein